MEKLDLKDQDAMLLKVEEVRNEFTDFQTVWSRRKKPSTSEKSDAGHEIVREKSKANQLYDGIRLRGVPESNAKTPHAFLAHDIEHVQNILKCLDVSLKPGSQMMYPLILFSSRTFQSLEGTDQEKIDLSSSHGGVLIAFKKSLNLSPLANNMVDLCDVVFTSIDRSSCIIARIYIPPKNSPYYWTTTKLLDFFKTPRLLLLHRTHSPEYMVIIGDLNFSSTNWGTMKSTNASENLFLDNLDDQGFQQKLHESAGRSLDVFLNS